jgi:TolB-like protein
MLEWPPNHRRTPLPSTGLPSTGNVRSVLTRHIVWAIILAAVIISGAIVGNGELDRRFRHSHPPVSPAVHGNLPAADKSVAVLKFQNLSGDAQDSLYADGLREDLIAQLAKISELKVIDLDPRQDRQTSYFTSSELGREIGVEYLVRCTIQRAANRVKLRAKLVRPKCDQTVWTETYEFEASDPLSLDPEIAKKISEELLKRIGSDGSLAALSPKKT